MLLNGPILRKRRQMAIEVETLAKLGAQFYLAAESVVEREACFHTPNCLTYTLMA